MPAMQSLDAFLPYIQPWLLAAPDPLARSALLRAAREFCERTQVIEVTVTPLDATLGQADFPFTLPADLELVRVKRAWWGTDALNLAAPEDIDSPLAYVNQVGTTTRQNGKPSQAYLTGPLTLTVAPPTDTAGTKMLTLRVAVRPTLAATTLPDELLNDWVEGIVAGAVWVLAGIPGAPVVSAETQALAGSTYQRQMQRAVSVALRGRHQAPLAVRGSPFA